MSVSQVPARLFLAVAALCAIPNLVVAAVPAIESSQGAMSPAAASGYNLPPKDVLDVMLAPSPPQPDLSPTHDRMLLVSWQDYPSIGRVATPFLRLAGVRIEPKNHSKHDTPAGYGITPCIRGLELVQIANASQTHIDLPHDACPNEPIWSADGKWFAFENIATESVELWIGDARTGALHRVAGARLNPMFGGELRWMPDQSTLLVSLVPEHLGPAPAEPSVPSGPSIQESTGEKGQSSTYENRDTLTNVHDEDLFDYYAASQIALIDARSGRITTLGAPDRIESVQPAPDGHHLLVSTLKKPYSYITTFDRFPTQVDVWDISKPAKIAVHPIATLPLADRVPIRGVPVGPRAFTWRATGPTSLIWLEALDGGDWNITVPARDKLMILKAPFDGIASEITRTEQRIVGLIWSEAPGPLLVTEYDSNRHWRHTSIINIDDPEVKPRVLWDLSTDERYANPGEPILRELANGVSVLRQQGDSIFLAGAGASPQGNRPFLDELDLKTMQSKRLFRSSKSEYEQFLAFTGANQRSFLTWHQTPMDPPNAFIRTLGSAVDAPAGEALVESTSVALTHIPDPTPVVRQIKKRLVKYQRADGLDLSFTLYTPPGYQEGTRVPTILYAYPLDYADASKAGQVV